MVNKLSIVLNLLAICSILLVVALITALNVPEKELPEIETQFFCGTVSIERTILTDLSGYELFNENCKTCHSVYKKVIGPALGNVVGRRDSLWIAEWILDNEALRKVDKTAQNLYTEYNKTSCLKNQHFSNADISDLIIFLQQQNEISQ